MTVGKCSDSHFFVSKRGKRGSPRGRMFIFSLRIRLNQTECLEAQLMLILREFSRYKLVSEAQLSRADWNCVFFCKSRLLTTCKHKNADEYSAYVHKIALFQRRTNTRISSTNHIPVLPSRNFPCRFPLILYGRKAGKDAPCQKGVGACRRLEQRTIVICVAF